MRFSVFKVGVRIVVVSPQVVELAIQSVLAHKFVATRRMRANMTKITREAWEILLQRGVYN